MHLSSNAAYQVDSGKPRQRSALLVMGFCLLLGGILTAWMMTSNASGDANQPEVSFDYSQPYLTVNLTNPLNSRQSLMTSNNPYNFKANIITEGGQECGQTVFSNTTPDYSGQLSSSNGSLDTRQQTATLQLANAEASLCFEFSQTDSQSQYYQAYDPAD